MRQVRIPPLRIETQYIKFKGGVDLATPVLSITPGNAIEAMNYEPGLLGGYKRIDGFERYDGRPSPSAATYLLLERTAVLAVALGATVTGATSGATGIAARASSATSALCVTKTTGTFVAGEQLLVGGQIVGVLKESPALRGYRTALEDAVGLGAAADMYRTSIGAVPGVGPVRGVWMFSGALYAWRDAVGGASCAMYKATANGWTAVALGEEIAFTNANTFVQEGSVLSQAAGAKTALIARVVLETGSLASGVNTGRLILKNRTGTGFASGAATTTGAGAGTLTLGGAQTAITLLPGGRLECVNANLGGATSTNRMYGCDGKNRAFEFDGSTYVPIRTGAAVDAPNFIMVHKQRLFLALGASIQWSGDGNPYLWTVTAGAGVAGVGDTITGLAVQAGDVLAIFSRNLSNQLQGATNNSFQMTPISAEIGALAYSVQTIGKTLGMDDRGIISTDRTQAFGNFVQGTISAMVQPLVDALRQRVVGSVVYRNRGQYRVFGSDGSGLIASFGQDGALLGITQLQYPVNPTCFASCEDATGKDAVFFGADNGYVYQADTGSSFDGQEIECYLRMPFNNVGGPRIRKRFRKAVLEMAANGYAKIRFQPEFSYGDPDVGTHRLQSGEVLGGGGHWDSSTWGDFFYDTQIVSSPAFSIEGTGLNMALLFYSSSAIDLGHTLQGMQIHYSLRRLER